MTNSPAPHATSPVELPSELPQRSLPQRSQPGRIKTLPPLSPLTYYRRNIWRTLPVGGAIVISVFLIAAIVTLLNSVDDSITTNYGFLRRFSILATQLEKDVPPQVLKKVKAEPHLGRILSGVPYILPIRTVFGEMPCFVYGMDERDIEGFIQTSGNRLAQGRLPRSGEPEIALSRAWANNFGKGVGQQIKINNERLPTIPEAQTIVGIFDGGENIALTSIDYLLLTLPEPVVRTSYLLIPKPGQMKQLNEAIEDITKRPTKHGLKATDVRFVRFFTFAGLVAELRKTLGFLYKFLAIADILVIGAVALLSGFLANIYFEQRLGEFGLLSAFGFRRERLARRLMIESGALVAFGWVLGLAMTWLLFRALDAFYMTPRGLVLAKLDATVLLYTMPTPILVGLASLATVLFRLYKFDPIEIMERR